MSNPDNAPAKMYGRRLRRKARSDGSRANLSAIVRIFDNGGRTFDRYTIMPPEWATGWRNADGRWQAIASSEDPFHPQGFGQTADAIPGEHLGELIAWNDLPVDVQRFARRVFPAFCPPPPRAHRGHARRGDV